VPHTCTPSYLEGRDWEDHGLMPAEQKVSEMPLQATAGGPSIPATQEA
jgi:hypothetical protein